LQDYNIKVKWKPGKQMIFADLLSRTTDSTKESTASFFEEKVINIINEIE